MKKRYYFEKIKKKKLLEHCSEGGKARAESLTQEELSAIGVKAGTACLKKNGRKHYSMMGKEAAKTFMEVTTPEWRKERAMKAVAAKKAKREGKK